MGLHTRPARRSAVPDRPLRFEAASFSHPVHSDVEAEVDADLARDSSTTVLRSMCLLELAMMNADLCTLRLF